MGERPLVFRSSAVRVRLPAAVAPTAGNRLDCSTPYCARAFSMASTATRRSRLFCSASATSSRRRGSCKNSCQPMGPVSGASAVPSGPFGPFVPFSVAGTGSMGRA